MNVLLIGGTGILSTEVCRAALELGMEVTVINRGRRKEFLNQGAVHVTADVRKDDARTLREKTGGKQFDVVVDFISYCPEQLRKSIDAFGNYCKHFIFISSATVYKEADGSHLYTEKDDIHNDKWKYCADKAACEELLSNGSWPFAYSVIRPYVTYGKTRIPFQIIPLKYYTLLNRIKNGKPVIAANKSVVCTLTHVKDFAVGAVGLFNNPEAFGEAVHITSNYRYSWERVAEILGNHLGVRPRLIELDMEFLRSVSDPGFELEELEGDKARNMLFDNTKIKRLSPRFTGDIPFEEGVKEALAFFSEPGRQTVDYLWEGRIDRLLHIFYIENRINYDKADCSLRGNKEKISVKGRILYGIGRYELLYTIAKWGKKTVRG